MHYSISGINLGRPRNLMYDVIEKLTTWIAIIVRFSPKLLFERNVTRLYVEFLRRKFRWHPSSVSLNIC